MSLIQEGGSLNAFDVSPQPIVPGTIGVTNKAEGEVGGRLMTKDAQVLVNDGANNRVLVGQRADGSYGIDVSKTGFDTGSGAANLVMSSSFNSFKIVATGTIDLVVPGSPNGTYTSTVTHSLGYIPAIISYVKDAGGIYAQMPLCGISLGAPNTVNGNIYATVTTTTATFNVITNNGFYTGTLTFRYYLMQETAA